MASDFRGRLNFEAERGQRQASVIFWSVVFVLVLICSGVQRHREAQRTEAVHREFVEQFPNGIGRVAHQQNPLPLQTQDSK